MANDAELLSPLIQSLDWGLSPGDDDRFFTLTDLMSWDGDSNRGLVSLDGGDPTWLLTVADTYWPDVVGTQVTVLRNPFTGKGALIMGPVGSFQEPDDNQDTLPAKAKVIEVPGPGRVVVQSGPDSFTARTVITYADPTVGDIVALNWASDGSEVIATGEVGAWSPTKPARPGPPSLTRSGTTVTVRWGKPNTVDTTRVRYRYGGGSWSEKRGLTGTSTTIPIAANRVRQVQIAQSNAGGTSDWSRTSEISGAPTSSAPSKPGGSGGGGTSGKPKYETVTKTISPTSTGTYRHSVNRWDDWNRGRYGFPYSLYQGSKYGSGNMSGLATYGSRIKDLRAVEIISIEVRLVDANLGDYSVGQPIRVQTSPNGSRPGGAPSTGGESDTTSLGKGQSKWFKLNLSQAALNRFRDGDLRGLVINGGPYRAVKGRGSSGMSVRVKYRRRA